MHEKSATRSRGFLVTNHNREEVAKMLDELGVTVVYADDPVDGLQIEVVHLSDLVKIGHIFEQTHTPTSDEREALRNLLYQSNVVPFEAINIITDRILTTGFRRTVTPEPSAPAKITIEHEGGNTVTGTPEQVLNHGHLMPGWKYRGAESQAEPAVTLEPLDRSDPRQRAEYLAASKAAAAMANPLDQTRRDAQAEPTDAQVLAASNAYMHYKPPYDDLNGFSVAFLDDMRAALRAASEARGEGR